MTKSKTIGYFLLGIFVVWYLIGSGMGLEYSKNIIGFSKGESIRRPPRDPVSGAYYYSPSG